jgi:hypothetical protein
MPAYGLLLFEAPKLASRIIWFGVTAVVTLLSVAPPVYSWAAVTARGWPADLQRQLSSLTFLPPHG